MQLPHDPTDGLLSASKLAMLAECGFRAAYNEEQAVVSLELGDMPNESLIFGKVWHKALYLYHAGTPDADVHSQVSKSWDDSMLEFREKAPLDYDSHINGLSKHSYKTLPVIWDALRIYREARSSNPSGTIMAESTELFTLAGQAFRVTLDRLYRDSDGQLVIVDYKTTSGYGGPGYARSWQGMLYAWWAWREYGQVPIVEIDVLHLTCRRKKDETWGEVGIKFGLYRDQPGMGDLGCFEDNVKILLSSPRSKNFSACYAFNHPCPHTERCRDDGFGEHPATESPVKERPCLE